MQNAKAYVDQLNNQEIKCKSCGATFDVHLPECPYCGETNEYGDELSYQQHLEDIYDDMEEMVDDSLEGATEEIKETGRGAIKYFMIIVIPILCVALIVFGIIKYSENKKARTAKAALLWEKETYPKLDAMYEAGDYDGILEFSEALYGNDNYEDYSLYNWSHDAFLSGYMYYRYMLDSVGYIENGKEHVDYYKESILYYALKLKYEEWDVSYNISKRLTKKDYELIKSYIAEADAILSEHFHLTQADCDELIKKCRSYPDSVVISWDTTAKIADGLEWID